MKPVIFKAHTTSGPWQVPGWIVPDTDNLLAIDMRYEADIECAPPKPAKWIITHRPTGFRITREPYTDAATRGQAIMKAQMFFAMYTQRGWGLRARKPACIIAPHQAMTQCQKISFWRQVAGWPITRDKALPFAWAGIPTSNTSTSAPKENDHG